MIKFDENIFYISGSGYAYAMYVNSAGYLQHAYYGKKLSFADIKTYIETKCKKFEPLTEDLNCDFALDGMPSEYGCYFNHGDYREPSVIIRQADGSAISRFRYASHEIKDGAVNITDMPHARGVGQTLSVTLKDDFSDTRIVLNYTALEDCDVIVRNAEIINDGIERVNLSRAFSCCLDLPEARYKLLRLHGKWANERNVETTQIGHGVTRLQSLRGASSHQMNPFVAILKERCDEDSGECYGFQLVYSGNFAITAEVNHTGGLRLQGGINDASFDWSLAAKARFVTPQVALCYSDCGIGQVSRLFADFIRGHIVNPKYANLTRPIVVNNWEATYFDFDNKKLFPIIDEAAKLGIDTFVLDDGWFGTRNDDTSGLGDWFVNEKKLKGGLKPLIDRCKKNGLKFGIWFEPEAISEDSDLYRSHPDWAIGKDGVQPAHWRNQLVLDFTRKDVVNYVYDAVSKILKNNEISYVKWDFNRNITEFYSRNLKYQGEFAHRYMLGVYSLADKLTKEFPDVFFEGCAGGGGRFDAGMLYYFPQIWTSDNTDAYERMKIQWGTSMCYPLSSMSCHVSACPNHQTGLSSPLKMRGAVASLGATGYELDLSKLAADEKTQIKEQTESYKKINSLILQGDLFRILSPFDNLGFSEIVVSKDKNLAYLVYVRDKTCANCRILKPKGLDGSKIYCVNGDYMLSGKELMGNGISVAHIKQDSSFAWVMKTVE